MINLEEYGKIVKSEFKFLEDFGFDLLEVKKNLFHFNVFYKKGDLIVGIEYSFRNEYIEVIIYKNVLPDNLGLHSSGSSVGLEDILSKYKKGFNRELDYIPLMPKVLGVNDSLNKVAELFKQYASDFLTGTRWESWGDITGYRK